MSLIGACWSTWPFTVVLSSAVAGSISSGVTSHGPNEPERSKFLPAVNCEEWRW